MGHIRLGTIPKTRKWTAVVAAVAGGGEQGARSDYAPAIDIERIATQTLDATSTGLEKAISDVGLRYTFYLLTQLVLATRRKNWQDSLKDIGINLSPDATLFDLTTEVQSAIDDY